MTITTTAGIEVSNVTLTAYLEDNALRVVRCYGVDREGQNYLWITGENGQRSRAIPVAEGVGAPGQLVTNC